MKKVLLELELTNLCNARCIMCPVPDMKRPKGFMTRKTFDLILNKGSDYGIRTIRLCGLGEPLVHNDFCDFFSSVTTYHQYATELITNGSLLSKEIVRCLAKNHLDGLSISFPSLRREHYETIMRGLVFQEVLERVVYAISELKNASDTHVTITSAITGMNADEKAQIQDFWIQQGVDRIDLHSIHNRGGYLKDDGLLPPSAGDDEAHHDSKTSLCPWPLRQFFIAWDGSVLLCCCDMEGEYQVGTIQTDGLSVMEKRQETLLLMPPNLCQRCSYQQAGRVL